VAQSRPCAPGLCALSLGRWAHEKQSAEIRPPAGERLSPEQWQQVKAVLDAVLALAPEERAAHLEQNISDPRPGGKKRGCELRMRLESDTYATLGI
jgi:hypothetical protein